MGKPGLLVITTALHHKHRYRLHNFLPYLSKYFNIDIIDLSLLSYDKKDNEALPRFLARVAKEVLENRFKEEMIRGAHAYTLRSPLPGDFGALMTLPSLRALMKRIESKKYHAMVATPFLAGFLALQLRRYLKEVPIIYEDVDRFFNFFKNPINSLAAKAIEFSIIRNSDCVIAASPNLYSEDISIRLGNLTYFVPNGIEYAKFRKSASKIQKRNKYALVYVGAIEWWSGLDLSVKALSLALKEIPNLKLYIIGEHRTPYGRYLKKLVKKLGLKDKIAFLGRRPYEFVINSLPRYRIGILTFPKASVTEKAFPYKVLEYCATGTPVIMTRVSALAPLIEKYGAGVVYDVDDIEGIASSITELVINDNVWNEYSDNAIRLASLFDVAKLARQEANIIYQVSHV